MMATKRGLLTPTHPDDDCVAPHELTGRLPKPFAPTCGRTTTSSGKPYRLRVPMWGDACARHAAIDSERTHA